MRSIRKSLHGVGIRDRDRLPAPFIRKLDVVTDEADSIHITHLCMKVQLDPPLIRMIIHPVRIGVFRFLDTFNMADRQLRGKLIGRFHPSGDHDILSVFDLVIELFFSVFITEKLGGNRVRLIRKIELENVFFVPGFDDFRPEQPALHDHIPHPLFELMDRNGLSVEIIAVDHVRVLGLFVLLWSPFVL